MTSAEIKEYLKMVAELEKQIYIQGKVLRELEKRSYLLARKNQYITPPKPIQSGNALYFAAGAVVGSVFLIIGVMEKSSMGILLGAVAMLVFGGLLAIEMKCNADKNTAYRREVKYYDRLFLQEEQNVLEEWPQKDALLADIQSLRKTNENTKETLEVLYHADILRPEHCSYPAVCRLNEYFEKGCCFSLRGAEDLLEQEVQKKRVCLRWSGIRNRQNESENRQQMFYDSLQEADNTARWLLNACYEHAKRFRVDNKTHSGTPQKQIDSVLDAYEKASSRRELEYLNRMNELR